MKYYCIAEMEITDRTWVPDYVANVTKMVEAAGGKYLARSAQVEKLEGEREAPQFALIIEWPSRQAAIDFFESDAYRPYREMRQAGARNEFLLVAGEDVAQVARLTD
jgi:uncharacterized protein (DUF1330 family)